MTRRLSTTATPANIASVLHLLAATPQTLADLATTLSPEALAAPLGTGERSFSQDLAHLLHCEARTAEAIGLALLLDAPLLPDLHPERDWGRLLRYDLCPCDELLAYFRLRRAVLLRILHGLAPAQWARAVREEGKQRQESVYWLARAQALHEAEHTTDLAAKLGRA
jgi:hypothetical protein